MNLIFFSLYVCFVVKYYCRRKKYVFYYAFCIVAAKFGRVYDILKLCKTLREECSANTVKQLSVFTSVFIVFYLIIKDKTKIFDSCGMAW